MKPDKKYMSQSSNGIKDFNFVPPTFSSKIRKNELFDSYNDSNNSNGYNSSMNSNNYNNSTNSSNYNNTNSSNGYNGSMNSDNYNNSNGYNGSMNSNNYNNSSSYNNNSMNPDNYNNTTNYNSYNNPLNSNNYSGYNTSNNSSLDLYPSETQNEFLYCYYSSFGDCEENNKNNKNYTQNNSSRIPTPSEALINLDMDIDIDELNGLDRTCCDNKIDDIYSKIENEHSGIFTTLASYKIPHPISKIIIRRLIKLTLLYCEKEGD